MVKYNKNFLLLSLNKYRKSFKRKRNALRRYNRYLYKTMVKVFYNVCNTIYNFIFKIIDS